MSVFGFELSYYVGDRRDDLVLHRLKAAFERAALDVARPGQFLFPKLIELMEAEVKGQFNQRGRGPIAGKWQPLSPAYAKWKRQRYPGKPILVRTGDLKAGLTDSSSPFAARDYNETELNYGTAGVPYASFHQTGASHRARSSVFGRIRNFFHPASDLGRGAGGLPARPPIDFRQLFEKRVQSAALQAVRDSIRAARNEDLLQLEGEA